LQEKTCASFKWGRSCKGKFGKDACNKTQKVNSQLCDASTNLDSSLKTHPSSLWLLLETLADALSTCWSNVLRIRFLYCHSPQILARCGAQPQPPEPEHVRPTIDTCQMEEYLLLSSTLAVQRLLMQVRLGKREKELKPARAASSSITDSYPSNPDPVFGYEPRTRPAKQTPGRSAHRYLSPESCIHENAKPRVQST
jgi:hypothetical protein